MTAKRYPPPVVTGLSPKEGIPGTQITIRGENLGETAGDLIGLSICGTDCLVSARWESAHKVIARIGQAKGGAGDVLLTTKLGGRGSGTVKFRVYTVQIGPLQESAVWVDESRTVPGREAPGAASATLIDEDPLGISDERDERKKLPESTLLELYADGTGNRRLENFVPAWYLLENHRTASFADLKTGLAHMQRQAKSMREGPKDLLKSNLHSFINCVDSLSNLHNQLEKEKQQIGWPLTKNLEERVIRCRTMADELFCDVLGRKDRADATRTALSVLNRFKFLFFLPNTIETNLAKGDYSLVLNDYARAKSLFGDTDVPLFKEALVHVEDKMAMFKRSLKERLLEQPSNLDEQKKVIRYLLMLEPNSDPGADCLYAHHQWLENVLWEAQRKMAVSDRKLPDGFDSSSDVEEKLVGELPKRFAFVDSLLTILESKLLPFWKLAQAYITGSLSAKPNLHREDEVEQMLISITNLASWLLLNALYPESLPGQVMERYGDRFFKWDRGRQQRRRYSVDSVSSRDVGHMLRALQRVRAGVSVLHRQEFADKHLHNLHELAVTVRFKCLARIIDSAVESIFDLNGKETWKLQPNDGDCSKTLLPDMFENQVGEILPWINQILSFSNFPGEMDLFANEKFRDLLLQSFTRLMCSFRETLERLVRLGNYAETTEGHPVRPTNLSFNTSGGKMLNENGEVIISAQIKDKKLLIALGNCDYVLRFSMDTISERLRSNGVSNKIHAHLLERSRRCYAELRALLLKAYISAKCAPFADVISIVSYLRASIDDSCDGVSNYVKDLVLCVVSVQAELFLVAPHFTQQVLPFAVQACCQRLAEHFSGFDLDSFDSVAVTQAVADVSALEESLSPYIAADDTRRLLTDVRRRLSAIGGDAAVDEALVAHCLREYRQRMRLAALSLQPPLDTAEEGSDDGVVFADV